VILVIARGDCSDRLIQRLLDAQVPRHGIRQHGGFLRQKSTTLIIGVKPERIDNALALIREVCASAPDSAEHNATVFVLEAEQFIHF